MKFWIQDLFNACVVLSCIIFVDCQCMLPFTNGTWITSSRGTWTIPENRTEIQNFEGSMIPAQTIYDLSCSSSSGNQYILGTNTELELFPGITVRLYTCIEIRTTSFSPSKYEFYFVTDIDVATGEPFATNVSGVCTGATALVTGSNTNIVIADGTEANSVKETLPNVIRGEYRVTITDQNGVTGNDTLLSSCNDTNAFYVTEVVNATQTVSAVGFSDSGVMYNMKSFTSSGVTFIYTYNTDNTVNSISTYRFACWAVAQGSGTSLVYATVYPEVCQVGQNATNVPNGGQALVLLPSVTCPDSAREKGLGAAIIAVIVLVCILVLVGIVIVVIYFIRKKKRKDLSKPLPKNIKDEADGTAGRKGAKRPKSSNDLDTARLIDEKNKQKLAKKLAKKKETRTIAVQASIWTSPIKRTTTALKEKMRRSSSQSSVKFIPYVDKAVIVTSQQNDARKSAKSITRANTTVDKSKQDMVQPSVTRSKTTLEKKVSKIIPKYLVKKNKVSSPRQKLIKQISEIDSHSVDHYANEFETLYPFPHEGNPNDFHNTLDVPDETKNDKIEGDDEPKEMKQTAEKLEKSNPKSSEESKQTSRKREYTKTSLRSRPSTTDGLLGMNLNRSGSVRKTNSEQMERTRTINKFTYNSPYAMSEAQKEYSYIKGTWIRNQVRKDQESKKHFEDMKKLEAQRAFDAWIKKKRKSVKSVRTKFSRSSKTSSTSRSLVDSTSPSKERHV